MSNGRLAFVHQQLGGAGYDAALQLYSRVTSAWMSRTDLTSSEEDLLPDFNEITSSIGLCHEGKGDYDLALASYLSALRGYEEEEEYSKRVQILANIGLMYKVLEDYTRALDYFERARDAEEPDFKAKYDLDIQFCKDMLGLEGPRLEKEIEGLWKTLEVGEDYQKMFKEKLEATGKLKQAGLTLLKEEADRLWEMESNKLMEELGITVEDLEPKPTDTESKNTAIKDLEKKREEESSRLEKEIEGLWKTLEVGEDYQKMFKEKLEATGKLKQAGLTLLKEEADRLWEAESEELMEELGVMVEDLEPKPTDAKSKNTVVKDLKKKMGFDHPLFKKIVSGHSVESAESEYLSAILGRPAFQDLPSAVSDSVRVDLAQELSRRIMQAEKEGAETAETEADFHRMIADAIKAFDDMTVLVAERVKQQKIGGAT